jgi:hypothetical protein
LRRMRGETRCRNEDSVRGPWRCARRRASEPGRHGSAFVGHGLVSVDSCALPPRVPCVCSSATSAPHGRPPVLRAARAGNGAVFGRTSSVPARLQCGLRSPAAWLRSPAGGFDRLEAPRLLFVVSGARPPRSVLSQRSGPGRTAKSPRLTYRGASANRSGAFVSRRRRGSLLPPLRGPRGEKYFDSGSPRPCGLRRRERRPRCSRLLAGMGEAG